MAPKWEIVGERIINLTGNDGQPHFQSKARNGDRPGYRGENGKPGLPGLPGGKCFGIGNEFVNDTNLTIIANGGKGGPGQDGGDGAKGRDGATPTENDYRSFRRRETDTSEGFIGSAWNLLLVFTHESKKTYIVLGEPGLTGRNGGDGGREGLGERKGSIKIIGLNKQPSIKLEINEGPAGKYGRGGKGGEGGQNGNTIVVEAKDTSNYFMFFSTTQEKEDKIVDKISVSRCAENGICGTNNQNCLQQIQPQRLVQVEVFYAINLYKIFLREHLIYEMEKEKLLEFSKTLYENIQIRKIYNILGITYDLMALENHFYELRDKIDFLPFYYSLLHQVECKTGNDENLALLIHLKSVILAKIFVLRSSHENNLVIDIVSCINTVLHKIKEIRRTNNVVGAAEIVRKSKDEYSKEICGKIEEALESIHCIIIPEIGGILKTLDLKIDELLNNVLRMQQAAEKEFIKQNLIKEQRKAITSLKMRAVFGIVEEILRTIVQLYPLMTRVGELKSTQETIRMLPEIIDTISHISLQPVSKVIPEETRTKDKLMQIENTSRVGYDCVKIEELNSEFKDIANKRKGRYLQEPIQSTANDIDVVDLPLSFYMKLKNDNEKIKVVQNMLSEIKDEIQELSIFRRAIYNVMHPLFYSLRKSIGETLDSLSVPISKVNLDIVNLKISTRLKEIRHIMRTFFKMFNKNENLTQPLEYLMDATTTMINIFSRIQSYQEQTKLANYMAQLASWDCDSSITSEDSEILMKLDGVINYNIALGHYEKAINALKQYIFPFANLYLEELAYSTLDIDSNINNTEIMVKQLETLESRLRTSNSIIDNRHEKLLYTTFFSSEKQSSPFYVWKNEDHRIIISRLLSGCEVTLTANITRSSEKRNAIKFKEIKINLKSKSIEEQVYLERELKNFSVKMIHLGNSYYRCNNKYYLITSDRQTLEYSYEEEANGNPLTTNSVYDKLRHGAFMLSPYATWKIQLTHTKNESNFFNLKRFEKHLDLELIGIGQYVSEEFSMDGILHNYYEEVEDVLELQEHQLNFLEDQHSKLYHIDFKYLEIGDCITNISEDKDSDDDDDNFYDAELIKNEKTNFPSVGKAVKAYLINPLKNMFLK